MWHRVGAAGAAVAVSCGSWWVSASAEERASAGGGTRCRVLITGFHDWHEPKGNVWRCEYNPTGRLLLGDDDAYRNAPPRRGGHAASPGGFAGPLPRALAAARPDIDWHYTTLPVLWGISAVVDYAAYDCVVHMGLYGSCAADEIVVEDGAYNGRASADCVGQAPPDRIDAAAPQELRVPRLSALVRAQHDRVLPGGFRVVALPARAANRYICNETHWQALEAAAAGLVDGGYFVHIPFPTVDDADLAGLAEAVGNVVVQLAGHHAATKTA